MDLMMAAHIESRSPSVILTPTSPRQEKKNTLSGDRRSIDLARDLDCVYTNTKDTAMKNWYNVYAYTRMPFGVHRGKYMKDVPDGYLKWGVIHCADRATADMFSIELQRRYPALRK